MRASNYGTLAKMETLSNLLNDADSLLSDLRGSLDEAAGSQAARAKRNAQLMDRLKTMKSETNNQVSAILGKMFGMSGKDPKSMMSEDKTNEYLITAFRVNAFL